MATQQWPIPTSWSQIDPNTNKRVLLSEVERRQQYLDIMCDSDADLKPLVVSCLEDDPKLRPPAAGVSESIKKMKEEYSKKICNGMDPTSCLTKVKQTSAQLQVC